MKDLWIRFEDWLFDNKWYIAAYVVFIALFWFIGTPKVTPAEAYFGLCFIHLFYFLGVHFVKKIYTK